ncbi:histidine acid phosphatase [Phlyctema vagabunda]|uniref:Phytase A n=1 Tax=Phlyctema vagabunda TaxID=108571 RepID=A0ABR4P4V7_9HELO
MQPPITDLLQGVPMDSVFGWVKALLPWGSHPHKYQPLPHEEGNFLQSRLRSCKHIVRSRRFVFAAAMFGTLLLITALLGLGTAQNTSKSCDTIDGYVCQPNISQLWGQYSPYFSVPSEISAETPDQCTITFAQILSRHGARDPTEKKTAAYNATILKIHASVTEYSPEYAFIKDYEYTLGADQLSLFGQQELINSGTKFFTRYQALAKDVDPFVRSSGQDRVVESAQNWTLGFHNARVAAGAIDSEYPYSITLISEEAGFNNSLSHSLCTSFEDGPVSSISDDAQATFASTFTPPITVRLNENLPGANLSMIETIYMMDMCPFNTVASDTGSISPFCALFTEAEWNDYGYYQTLSKYYGYDWGNPLGATQGVGFTNELIARLTNASVIDHTSTNSTLDASDATFPLGAQLYADFSHDSDMIAIYAAMGLYNSTAMLSNTTAQGVNETNGYSTSYVVPFAARAYFEKMSCGEEAEEMVRVIVNDRVLPLESCGGDALGRCTLSAFVDSLTFAKSGGDWDQCFV